MEKLHRARYTLEYKLEALRLIETGPTTRANFPRCPVYSWTTRGTNVVIKGSVPFLHF